MPNEGGLSLFKNNSIEDRGGSQEPLPFIAKMSHRKLSTAMVWRQC